MAEFLALVDVRDVHLDGAHAAAGDGIAEGDRDVGVASRVDHQELHALIGPLRDRVDDLAFVVGLEETGLRAGGLGMLLDELLEVAERLGTVDLRLALAESVEVGAVDDADFHGYGSKRPGGGGQEGKMRGMG